MPPRTVSRRTRLAVCLTLAGLTPGTLSLEPLHAQTLVGSPASMDRQNREAETQAFTYLRNPEDIEVFVRHSLLVYVPGNGEYLVDGASFPYARPEVKRFLEWMGHLSRTGCGEPVVATSLVRPKSHQPRNASIHSVHPTGMAMDLRRSSRRACSGLLESTLLELESRGILEATKERSPAHYHVALFPEAFSSYLLAVEGGRELPPMQLATIPPPIDSIAERAPSPSSVIAANERATRAASRSATHRVRRGDTLSRIAGRYGVSTASLRRANGLRGSTVRSGQRLRIPGASSAKSQSAESASISVQWSGTKTAATRARTVRVGRGDTLSSIAQRHGTTISSLRKVNGLRGSTVRAGQTLKVPSSGGSVRQASSSSGRSARSMSAKHSAKHSAKSATKRVRVGRGQTLWQIARQNGISVASLQKANGLRSGSVKAGQLLSIPAR